MKLSNLIIDSYIQKFSESDNFCGFTLPFVFADGSPAIIHAHRFHADDVQLNDYGLNMESMVKSINNEKFDAEAKIQDLIRPFDTIRFEKGSIISSTNPDELMFALMDFSDLLKAMVEYKYSPRVNHIDEILHKIQVVLEKKYNHLKTSPELFGRSGNKYKFDFGSDNNLIDFTTAKTEKTNKLLRKFIDTQNSNPDLSFTVIIDDLENDRYKSEESILGDFAKVQHLSRYVAA